ncbi:MAG TPA: hypothetical protein VK661_01710 [Planctomycetota bacterium]|nr:hypothetical protein [Planctomycetota bacterium]
MRLIPALPVLLALAACGTTSGDARYEGPEEVRRLIRDLDGPVPSGTPMDKLPEARLAELGDEALPALAVAVRDPGKSPLRERAARALGLLQQRTGSEGAIQAYIVAVQKATAVHARGLLAQAHRFHDPEGRILALVHAALNEMGTVTPEMVASAGAMTDVESLEAMKRVVVRNRSDGPVPGRDVALRYIGRAARRGWPDAVKFLLACTQAGNADIMEKAGRELGLVAGRIKPKSWSGWWLDHATSDRRAWILESFPPVNGQPFDPADRDHIDDLISRVPETEDAEPEFWLIERLLGKSFGYASPRDNFDPDVEPATVAESNRRAVETLKAWWREYSPYVFFNRATNLFEVNDEGRRIGVPVDPKTGKPGR